MGGRRTRRALAGWTVPGGGGVRGARHLAGDKARPLPPSAEEIDAAAAKRERQAPARGKGRGSGALALADATIAVADDDRVTTRFGGGGKGARGGDGKGSDPAPGLCWVKRSPAAVVRRERHGRAPAPRVAMRLPA